MWFKMYKKLKNEKIFAHAVVCAVAIVAVLVAGCFQEKVEYPKETANNKVVRPPYYASVSFSLEKIEPQVMSLIENLENTYNADFSLPWRVKENLVRIDLYRKIGLKITEVYLEGTEDKWRVADG